MTFASVGSSFGNSASPITVSLTPTTVGDFILAEVINNSNSTVFPTALSSTNVTWTTLGSSFAGTSIVFAAQMFIGKVTSTATATVTATWSGTTPASITIAGQEFSATGGFSAVTLDVQGHVDTSAGNSNWASLLPGHGSGELYFGFASDGGTAVAGTTSGYTYVANADTTSDGIAYNPSCPNSATFPVWNDSSQQFGIMVLVYEATAPAGNYGQRLPMSRFAPLARQFPGVPFAENYGVSGTPSGTVSVSDTDAGTALDAGEHVAATLSDTDVSKAADGGEVIHVSDTDACRAADAGEHVTATLSDTDASTAADSGTSVRLSSSDVSTAADAGEHVAATLSDTDVSKAAESNGQIHVSDADASTALDAGEHTSATLSSPDASTVLDASEQIHVSSSDASTASENNGNTSQTVTSSDASTALDAGEVIKLTGVSDASTALDAGEHITATLSAGDASTALDAGEHIAASLSDTDAATGSDTYGVINDEAGGAVDDEAGDPILQEGGPEFIIASLSSSDAAQALDGGEGGTGGHVVHDTETCQAVDSGFTFLSDSDACQAVETVTTITQFVHDSDACTSLDAGEHITGTFLKSDTDACTAAETTAFFTGTLFTRDTDFCVATDTQPPNNRIVSDSDACTSLDNEHETVEVFTYQPPFRWTGGGFEVVWHVLEGTGEAVITVWRGPLPDAGVYRLHERLASAGEVRHVHDDDACQAADSELAPEFGVSVSHRPALDLSQGVRIMGPGERNH